MDQRILIVDDEKIIINFLRGSLQSDYLIQAAKNSEKALKIAAESPPDLILLDIMMPKIDGYEVCKRLKSDDKTKNIPVIFLTAMKDSGYETKGLELGAVDYITKPINTAILKTRVKHHLEREGYRKHLEKLVEKRTEELRIANKAKGDFLMNMNHELRTPLNGVLMAAELISTCETTYELKEVQGIISSSGNSLLNTLERISDFTRSKNGEIELESLPFCLDEALSEINTNFFHKGTKLYLKPKIDIDTGSVPNKYIGDEARIIEILNLLLENAAKFTTSAAEATLNIKAIEKSMEEVLLEFSLTDNGIGIEEADLEKIFEPFFKVDTSLTRKYEGIGIGLSICKQLVELMGGQIRVTSELNEGSVFSFTLKLKQDKKDA
ncbi:MAG: response regulator [Desulfobacterales bacterium]|nr:response regulator [Desulfobacterales bacterium]